MTDPTDKIVARAIARNTNFDPEIRLKMARQFDPNVKLNEGVAEDYKKYEESIIRPSGRVPAKKTKTQIAVSASGDVWVNQMQGDEVIDSKKLERTGAK